MYCTFYLCSPFGGKINLILSYLYETLYECMVKTGLQVAAVSRQIQKND